MMLFWVQTYSAVNWQIIVSHMLVCLLEVWKFKKEEEEGENITILLLSTTVQV